MVQSYKSGQVFRLRLKFVKIFWACLQNFFITSGLCLLCSPR